MVPCSRLIMKLDCPVRLGLVSGVHVSVKFCFPCFRSFCFWGSEIRFSGGNDRIPRHTKHKEATRLQGADGVREPRLRQGGRRALPKKALLRESVRKGFLQDVPELSTYYKGKFSGTQGLN
eukprot:gene2359-biopygen11424